MAKVLVCDICKRSHKEVGILVDIETYALKRKRAYTSGWDKYDICDDCVREIRLKVRKDSEVQSNGA